MLLQKAQVNPRFCAEVFVGYLQVTRVDPLSPAPAPSPPRPAPGDLPNISLCSSGDHTTPRPAPSVATPHPAGASAAAPLIGRIPSHPTIPALAHPTMPALALALCLAAGLQVAGASNIMQVSRYYQYSATYYHGTNNQYPVTSIK